MSKTLDTIQLSDYQELKDIKVQEEGVVLTFEKDVIELRDFHSQDCCENVYADWEVFKHYAEQLKGTRFNTVSIRGVEGEGLMVCFSDYPLQKVFVPCYNSQNGYYSDNLELQIKHGDVTKTIDITDYEESDID